VFRTLPPRRSVATVDWSIRVGSCCNFDASVPARCSTAVGRRKPGGVDTTAVKVADVTEFEFHTRSGRLHPFAPMRAC